RAWNRLPPVVSNRRGTVARIELWIKNTCRPLTRWFTWEQVNFNRAVHDALSDAVRILLAEAQELAALRWQMTDEMRRQFVTLKSEVDGQAAGLLVVSNNQAEYEARLKETDAALVRISNMLGEFAAERRAGRSQLASQITELAAGLREEHSAGRSKQAEEINQRLSELNAELREEQRVCFRQLSLEASEAAVLEDRGRRALEQRLEKLEKSLESRNL
ncbi:MAG: hypothetical protein ABR607_14450, partial [Pyrinomonadaceae bacterium]